jgi:GxxExxY protein
MHDDKLSHAIIGCAMDVHSALGPGLLDSTYKECMRHELIGAKFHIEVEKPVPIIYKNVVVNPGYRMDFLVEGKVVVELKVVETFAMVHYQQVLIYLRLGNYKLGLLINFNDRC